MLQNISGVILAGGKNSRFQGKQKALLEMKGQSIIEHTLSVFQKLFDDVFIISNTPDEFREITDVPIYSDVYKNIGPLGGIHSALSNTKNEAVFVVAADMPFVTEAVVMQLYAYYNQRDVDILIPRVNLNIEPLHAIYRTSIRPKLELFLNETENYSIRKLFDLVRTEYYLIPDVLTAENPFVNINTPEEYAKYFSKRK